MGFVMQDKNMGLLDQALARAPRWSIKKLTATYLTLALSDIGRAVKIDSEEEVRALILSMVCPFFFYCGGPLNYAMNDVRQIESSEISAQISADGTVTFSDPPLEFSRADVDMMLQQAHEQSALLSRLEMELTRSREYLSKVRVLPLYTPTAKPRNVRTTMLITH